jgi:heme A synthase
MKRHSVKLSILHRTVLYGTFGLIAATGLVWKWTQPQEDAGATDEALRRLRPLLMAVHGYGAFVLDIVFGTLLASHARRSWNYGDNKTNGALIVAVLGLASLAGHSLYYMGDEQWRLWTARLHLALGLSLPVILIAHILLGRRDVERARAMEAESSSREG